MKLIEFAEIVSEVLEKKTRESINTAISAAEKFSELLKGKKPQFCNPDFISVESPDLRVMFLNDFEILDEVSTSTEKYSERLHNIYYILQNLLTKEEIEKKINSGQIIPINEAVGDSRYSFIKLD